MFLEAFHNILIVHASRVMGRLFLLRYVGHMFVSRVSRQAPRGVYGTRLVRINRNLPKNPQCSYIPPLFAWEHVVPTRYINNFVFSSASKPHLMTTSVYTEFCQYNVDRIYNIKSLVCRVQTTL